MSKIPVFIFILYFNVLVSQFKAGTVNALPTQQKTNDDSIWSKILVKQRLQNGVIIEIGSEIYKAKKTKKENNNGILGNGQYEIIFSADSATFNEVWQPLKGNCIDAFKGEKISARRWIKKLNLLSNKYNSYFEMLELRFKARLIESIVEEGLVSLGFDKKEVKDDIVILDNGTSLDGKFVCFVDLSAMAKYTKTWKARTPTPPHKSFKAFNSKEIFDADVLISLYDGKRDTLDLFPPHIGLIRKGFFNHCLEALHCIFNGGLKCNLAAKNALRVKYRIQSERLAKEK